MKKLIFISLMLLIGASAFSIELYTFGGLSVDIDRVDAYHSPDKNWFETSIAAGVQHTDGPFTIYAEAETITEMHKASDIYFRPIFNEYYVRGGLWLFMFHAEFEHVCYHNVDLVDPSRNGGHNRLTIGFDSRRINGN